MKQAKNDSPLNFPTKGKNPEPVRDPTSHREALRAMIAESERLLSTEWVQQKLEKRWLTIAEGKGKAFSL